MNVSCACSVQPPPALIAMRHSVRADMCHNWTELWDPAERQRRPHDSPIANYELPVQCTQRFLASPASFQKITRIVSSPFRRCLQTAGAVCRTLGLDVVEIDFGLCEGMSHVRALHPPELSFLSPREMAAAVNSLNYLSGGSSDIKILLINKDNQTVPVDDFINLSEVADIPKLSETVSESFFRFNDCYRRTISRHLEESEKEMIVEGIVTSDNPGSVVCVTHWEGVSTLLAALLESDTNCVPNRKSYSTVSECGYIALELTSHTFIDSQGIQFS